MADQLKQAVDNWSRKTPQSFGLAALPETELEQAGLTNPLLFSRGQEAVDLMRQFNKLIGDKLTDAQMVAGINKFGKAQFDLYGRPYQVDSDPFNIARWSMALALVEVEAYETADKLLKATEAQQKITAQYAIEIGELADKEYLAKRAWYEEASKPHEASLGEIIGAVATGLGVMFAPVGIAGALGGLAGGATGAVSNLIGLDGLSTFGADALTGEGASLANNGYVDALGGMTDATGTALSGWSEMATTTAITETATIVDTSYVDALGGMTDATGTALETWTETATSTATTGATNVDSISDWLSNYSSDPGADPFATTEQVNAGWSFDGGYPGVDWYNSAGVGEASSATSLNDIFSNVSKAIKSATSILTSAQQLAAGQNRVQPNMTRTHAAGQMNLALPLLLGAAFFAFRG